MMSWREYLKAHMKGKKFESRQASNAFFKKLAEEYRKQKSVLS